MHSTNFIAEKDQVKTNQFYKTRSSAGENKIASAAVDSSIDKKSSRGFFLKPFATSLVLLLFSILTVSAQQSTQNSADQTLRSNGRVNPSSLGMEMSVPLGSYPARGINLPLGLSYSSKLWRFEQHGTMPSGGGSLHIFVKPMYSENSASGWTTSLSPAYIEYTGMYNLFDNYGRPLQEIYSGSQPPGENYIRRITAHLPSGESHELVAQHDPIPVPTLGGGPPASAWEGTFYATDGSGIKFVQNSSATPNPIYRLYMPDGSYYDLSTTTEHQSSPTPAELRRASRLTDVHGNYAEFKLPDPNNSQEMAAYPYGYCGQTRSGESSQ